MRIVTLVPVLGRRGRHGERRVVDERGHSAAGSGRQLEDPLEVAAKLTRNYADMRAGCDGNTAGTGRDIVKLGKVHQLAGGVGPRAGHTGRSWREDRLSQIGDVEIAGKFIGGERDAGGAIFGGRVELPALIGIRQLSVKQRRSRGAEINDLISPLFVW